MKKTITALAAAAFLAAGIGGASAATAYSSIAACDALDGDPSSWSTTPLADKLEQQGVTYDSIDTFGPCFKVMKTNADGSTELQLYDPSTLNLIHT